MKQQSLLILLLISCCSVFCIQGLQAQTSCDNALIEADNLYQSGQLYAIENKLLPCLESGFSLQEKQNAYRLLTLTYLNINQEEKAKTTLHKLLQLNPDYVVTRGKDPVELVNLYQQFNVNPVFYAGIRAGIMASQPIILHQRTTSSLRGQADKFYGTSFGFMLGADFALPLYDNLLLEFSPSYTHSGYSFRSFYLTDGSKEETAIRQVQEVTGRERYQHLVLPLAFNLRLPAKQTKLFYTLGAGAGASFLLSSSFRDVNRINRQIFSEEITVRRQETTPFRRRVNITGQLELGLEYKYLGYFWGARTGFNALLLNVTQYDNQQELYLNTMSATFGWIDDDFLLTNGYISVFVRKPIYKFL